MGMVLHHRLRALLGGLVALFAGSPHRFVKLGFFTGLLFLILFGLSVVFALQLRQAAMTEDQAIIMTPTVNVKSSPSNASVDLFVLHEGTKVSILESADGWNKIRIANGSVGYLPEASMLPF